MALAPLSQFRVQGNLVFTAGQLGMEEDGSFPDSFRRQAELGLEALRDRLEEAGSSLERVVKATVFLTRREDFAELNEVYTRFFSEPFPARTTVVCELALPELLFEIEAVAELSP